MTEYPYRFDRSTYNAQIQERYADLEPGTETPDVVQVAGRVMTTREHGKIAFIDLKDQSGRVPALRSAGGARR